MPAMVHQQFRKEHSTMRGRVGLFGILGTIVLALLVGGIGCALGAGAGQPVAIVQPGVPGTVVYPVGYGHGFGFGWGFPFFGIFGLLFVFLLLGLIIRAFRPRPWGGPGGWGAPGGWGGRAAGFGPGQGWSGRTDEVPPPFRPMLEQWHRQAHGDPTSTSAEPGPDAPPPSR
jgi:hypothetical protein